MKSGNEKTEIYNLLVKLIDNNLNDQESDILLDWSRSAPDAVQTYSDFMQDYGLIRIQVSGQVEKDYGSSEDTDFDNAVWSALKDAEENAPIVNIPKQVEKAAIPVVVRTLESKETNKFYRIYNSMISIVAVLLIFFVVYANIFPPKYSIDVATVTDQLGVVWSSSSASLNTGERVLTYQVPYKLEKGIVQIKYDEGVDVIIEGPAEFTVEKKGLNLVHGRVYSYVSDIGLGFTVDTPNNRFIDLGTEFGVFVEHDAESELHVFTGKVQYYTGPKGIAKTSKTITANNARRFDARTGSAQVIPIDGEVFARDINSGNGLVWRGQGLNLAEIISGGNGFGNSGKSVSIDPEDGSMKTWEMKEGTQQGSGRYTAVPGSRYIDGVFVPDGGNGEIVVSSLGSQWGGPDTCGLYIYDIVANLKMLDDLSYLTAGKQTVEWLLLESQSDSVPVHVAIPEAWDKLRSNQSSNIFVHANLGITFDLFELKNIVPNSSICSFESSFGIVEKFMYLVDPAVRDMLVDVWILVDGEVRYTSSEINASSFIKINVELSDSDRFLTLVVTDSSGEDDIRHDWGLFVDPVINLEK